MGEWLRGAFFLLYLLSGSSMYVWQQ